MSLKRPGKPVSMLDLSNSSLVEDACPLRFDFPSGFIYCRGNLLGARLVL